MYRKVVVVVFSLPLVVEYVTYLQKSMKAQGGGRGYGEWLSGNNGMVIRKNECLIPEC